jgi:hypothetical protein
MEKLALKIWADFKGLLGQKFLKPTTAVLSVLSKYARFSIGKKFNI